jgi:CubicO group peptidase (beta-lactamase class C family)
MHKCVAAALLMLSACVSHPASGALETAEPLPAFLQSEGGALETSLSTFFRVEQQASGAEIAVTIRERDREPISRAFPQAAARPYWIGSLTKPITAAAIMKLEEQGKLSTSDPLSRFFPDAPADKRGVTLHHLLTHTSGLPRDANVSEGLTDRDGAVRAVLALPLAARPGGAVSYSNEAFTLLAAIVEIASGSPYESYVQAQVFDRAGMRSSGFWPAEHLRIPVKKLPRGKKAGPNWGYRGSTGVYSTSEDLMRFVSALREGRILSPEKAALAMSTRVNREGPASDIGYGWFLVRNGGRPVISHGGADDLLNHFGWIYVYPESDLTLTLLVSGVPEDRATEILRGALQRTGASLRAAEAP